MLQAVRDLHSLRVVHHDVKPENFCLGSNVRGEVKLSLIDMGLLEDVKGELWSISLTLPKKSCDPTVPLAQMSRACKSYAIRSLLD